MNQGQDLAPQEAIDPFKVDFRVPEMYLSKVDAGGLHPVAPAADPDTTDAMVLGTVLRALSSGAGAESR